jgi:hypothetical protein
MQILFTAEQHVFGTPPIPLVFPAPSRNSGRAWAVLLQKDIDEAVVMTRVLKI